MARVGRAFGLFLLIGCWTAGCASIKVTPDSVDPSTLRAYSDINVPLSSFRLGGGGAIPGFPRKEGIDPLSSFRGRIEKVCQTGGEALALDVFLDRRWERSINVPSMVLYFLTLGIAPFNFSNTMSQSVTVILTDQQGQQVLCQTKECPTARTDEWAALGILGWFPAIFSEDYSIGWDWPGRLMRAGDIQAETTVVRILGSPETAKAWAGYKQRRR